MYIFSFQTDVLYDNNDRFFGFLADEPNSETVIAAVYRDPLDDCMDGIEELAAGILRTSKLTIQGEPGGEEEGRKIRDGWRRGKGLGG